MAAGGEVALGHKRHNQFPVRQGIHDTLRFRCRASFDSQSPSFSSSGNKRMVGTTAAAPVSVFIGPLSHVRRVNGFGCKAGDND